MSSFRCTGRTTNMVLRALAEVGSSVDRTRSGTVTGVVFTHDNRMAQTAWEIAKPLALTLAGDKVTFDRLKGFRITFKWRDKVKRSLVFYPVEQDIRGLNPNFVCFDHQVSTEDKCDSRFNNVYILRS